MSQVFSATLSAMLTMLICMLVGFVLRTKKIEPEDTDSVLSKFLTFVVSPALTFNSFSQNFNLQSLKENYTIILYSLLIAASAVAIATFLARLFIKDGYAQGVYKYAIAFANFGYMGTALVLISMMMTSVTKLRCINIAGSLISMIYAIIVVAYPVVFLNAGLIIINALQLIIRPKVSEGNIGQ